MAKEERILDAGLRPVNPEAAFWSIRRAYPPHRERRMSEDARALRRDDVARVAGATERSAADPVTVEDPFEIRVGRADDRRHDVDLQRRFRRAASRAARKRSIIAGTTQPMRIPAKTRRPTAIAKAAPSARHERAVKERPR
jgi:hypothetical protein